MTASQPLGTILLAALIAANAALAQAQTPTELPSDMPAPTQPTIAPAAGTVEGEASFDEVLDAIRRDTATHGALSTISTIGSLSVVRMSDMAGADTIILSDALASHAEQIGRLRGTLAANETIASALEEDGVEPADVVSASVTDDGGLVVYVE